MVAVVEARDLQDPVRGRLELLAEQGPDLRPGQVHLDQVVGERLDREQLAPGDLAGLDPGPDAARVHERELGVHLGPLGVGDQVAERRLAGRVGPAVAPGQQVGGGDVDDLVDQRRDLLDGVVDDRLDPRVPGHRWAGSAMSGGL